MAQDSSLFRPEALDAHSDQPLGSIRLAQPIGHRAAALLAIAIVATIVAFAILGTYTRRATVPGLLEPAGGSLRLTAPAPGTVSAIRVVEGQRVAAGEPLFVLSGERRSASGQTGASIATQLDGRAAALDRDGRLVDERLALHVRSVDQRLAAIDAEIARLDHEMAIHAARRRLAQRSVERYEALAATGFVAPAQAQAKQDELLVLEAGGDAYARQRSLLARERSGLASQRAESRMQAETERAEIGRQRAALAQERAENDARRTTVVVAPHDGDVTAIAARPGQVVGAGALLATLMPADAALEAELFVSTRQSGFVATGQAVHLRFAAYPYQKFGMGDGVVASIESGPYAPQELPPQVAAVLGGAALQGAEPVYRVVVRLDRQTIRVYGRDRPLRPGLLLEADIVEDRRRLFEWLLEPIYGLVGR